MIDLSMLKRPMALLLAGLLLLGGCSRPAGDAPSGRSGVYYEIFVGSFFDSDGDGLGDLPGLISKLDYLKSESGENCLGVTGIWLMPVNPSPTYHKYDVTDYYSIDPGYGTMEDFEQLIYECAKRGIDVIIDLVINHTSSRHPWFLAAVEELETGTPPRYQYYYNFIDHPRSGYYPTAGGMYYEAHFWSEMPDLNMDSEELRAEIADIARFWLDKGVAGFRLDAARHIYKERDKNLEFWRWFSDICKEIKADVFLVGEVWDTESEILAYYGSGLNALFNFPFAGEKGIIHHSVINADGLRLATHLERFTGKIKEIDPDGLHAPFLSNHDTDRSAGYITDPNRRKLQASIYLLTPGVPFIYYGEELGMTGKGKDENKRTAMIWSLTDTAGQTNGPEGADTPSAADGGVAELLADPGSLLNYYRAVIALRGKYPSIQTGTVTNLKSPDRRLCAVLIGDTAILHNLSPDHVEADISSLCPKMRLGDVLSPTGEDLVINGETAVLPPYSTVIMVP